MQDNQTTGSYPLTVEEVSRLLREGESQYRIISENSYDTIWTLDLADGRFTYVSPSILRLRGYTPDEVVGQSMQQVLTPESFKLVTELLPRQMAAFVAGDREAGNTVIEVDQYHKDGSIVHTEVATSVITDPSGMPVALLGVSRDITRRKKVEQALRRRSQELTYLNRIASAITSSLSLEDVMRTMLNAMPEVFPRLFHTTVHLFNTEDGQLHSYPIIHSPPPDIPQINLYPGEGVAGWVFENRTGLNIPDVNLDQRFIQRPGERCRSLLATPLVLHGETLGVLSVTSLEPQAFDEHDLNLLENLAGYAAIALQNARLYEQTRLESTINQVLLKEVNHRVRNNMASILSLINIERNQVRSKKSGKSPEQILTDLSERIRSLLVLHDAMADQRWQSADVERLVRETAQAGLAGSPIHRHIHLQVEIRAAGPLLVSARQATNLALAINELATNSAKYAFQGRGEGRITILAEAGPGEGDLRIVYSDDGWGWPEDVLSGERENFGLSLIRSAVHDNLKLYNQQGAWAELIFTAALVEAHPPADV